MNKPLILVVEDDTPVRNLITTTLKAHDYRFLTAANGESAILEASSHIAAKGLLLLFWIRRVVLTHALTLAGKRTDGDNGPNRTADLIFWEKRTGKH